MIKNSNFNSFVRDHLENNYEAKNLFGMIKTINPANLEAQKDLPKGQRSILREEKITEAEHGGYNFDMKIAYNFKNKKTADLFESIFENLIKPEQESQQSLKEKREFEERKRNGQVSRKEISAQRRIEEKQECRVKDYELVNKGNGIVIVKMNNPLFISTKINDQEQVSAKGNSKVLSQLFEEVVEKSLNSGLYSVNDSRVNKLSKLKGSEVEFNEQGRAIFGTANAKKVLQVHSIDKHEGLNKKILEEFERAGEKMLNSKVLGLVERNFKGYNSEQTSPNSLLQTKNSKVFDILNQQDVITQENLNNNSGGLVNSLKNLVNQAAERMTSTFESPNGKTNVVQIKAKKQGMKTKMA